MMHRSRAARGAWCMLQRPDFNFEGFQMSTFSGTWLHCLLASTLAVLAAQSALAQSPAGFPAKPVRVVIGFAPGGPADMVGRLMTPKMSVNLGQQVVIENR